MPSFVRQSGAAAAEAEPISLTRLRMGILKPLAFGAAVAACAVPARLPAQATGEQKQSQVWRLQGLRTGYCVRFLIEPKAASRELKSGFRLIPATQDRSLHPALQQTIKGQPEFASWIPSSLCFYYTDAVQVGTRRVAEKNPRNQQMIAVWTVATQEQRSATRRDLALDIFAGRGSLIRAAEAAGVRLREATAAVIDSADTSNDVYNVKLERTLLVWRGRPTGDSTRVEQAIEEAWLVPGVRAGVWAVQMVLHPASSRPLVGSLSVEGKGDLSKALKNSPIRFVGPLYRGGTGELRFSR
jgi:hypothetical protein